MKYITIIALALLFQLASAQNYKAKDYVSPDELESWLSEDHLQDPWGQSYQTTLYIDGNPEYILLNDVKIRVDQKIIPLEVFPGKYLRRLKTKS